MTVYDTPKIHYLNQYVIKVDITLNHFMSETWMMDYLFDLVLLHNFMTHTNADNLRAFQD